MKVLSVKVKDEIYDSFRLRARKEKCENRKLLKTKF